MAVEINDDRLAASVTVKGGPWSAPYLEVNGQRAPKGSARGTFALPTHHGDTINARIKPAVTRTVPTVVVGDREHVLGETIPWWLLVIAFIPAVLVGVGGMLGGALGGAAAAANFAVARTTKPVGEKVVTMIGISAAAIGLWFAIAQMLG